MIDRSKHLRTVLNLLHSFPVVGILGARQTGKTTLARQVSARFDGAVTHFDLEDPTDLARLAEPGLTLRGLEGLVILDEIQRSPNLFPLLRVLADRPENRARFLVLGSAGPTFLRQSSESLAGRIAYHELRGFDLGEAGDGAMDDLWSRGGFPRSFLARSDEESFRWRMAFVKTYLERDLPQLGVTIPAQTLRRFWTMLAHFHGQRWNSLEFARSFGTSDTTVRRYLDLLSDTFIIRQLQPWHENIGKRQVKAPKVYFYDSGLLHALLGIESISALLVHPRLGASWEGFALECVVGHLEVPPESCFHWATHGGAELDLLVIHGGKKLGFEFKRTDAPRLTPSMRSAAESLALDRLFVVHAGDEAFPMSESTRAVPLNRLADELRRIFSGLESG